MFFFYPYSDDSTNTSTGNRFDSFIRIDRSPSSFVAVSPIYGAVVSNQPFVQTCCLYRSPFHYPHARGDDGLGLGLPQTHLYFDGVLVSGFAPTLVVSQN